MRTVTKLAGYERMNALLIALTTLLLPPAAQAALPKYAFSVPAAQSLSDGAKAAETCGLKGKIWVMPALSFHLANDDQAGEFQEQTAALMGISDDAEVFLHVKVGGGTAAASPIESKISDRVAAFLKRLPLSAPPVRGLILEIEEPLENSQLFAFALVDLAVAA